MLVQKRSPDSDRISIPPPTIRVRVKYGSIYHEIHINSQATYERDSKVFLDMAGVKDKSKIVLIKDPISQEKRLLEMRKNAKMEKASKSISEISLEIRSNSRMIMQSLFWVLVKGGRVGEKDVVNLIELLMNQLLKLDGIMVDEPVAQLLDGLAIVITFKVCREFEYRLFTVVFGNRRPVTGCQWQTSLLLARWGEGGQWMRGGNKYGFATKNLCKDASYRPNINGCSVIVTTEELRCPVPAG
ncbi:BAG family molecular chaperone regulator 3 [Hibiscus syriacus]|uniref:BAG family molecular chaperone regulator 3 n=1 Tax=Hibiscus syriacus TaxID=106335 RepID=A0A6A2XWU2_HIBSY|nr:BAG family molecular chaperone regulator 3 [Hibiscus syriacus]